MRSPEVEHSPDDQLPAVRAIAGHGRHEPGRDDWMVYIARDVAEAGAEPVDIDRWRDVPVAIAVDLNLDPGQIDPAIRPLMPPGQQPRLFGRAVTVQCEPPDFGAVLHALTVVQPGDVVVIAAGGDNHTAMIGEILCGHLRALGAVGLVCDGAVRDVATLAGWSDFAVFSRHVTPRGPVGLDRGSVHVPVEVGGCRVSPGDLIIGDDDGLVALSSAAIRYGLAGAEAKIALEAEWIASLERGTSVEETFGLSAAT